MEAGMIRTMAVLAAISVVVIVAVLFLAWRRARR